MYLLQIWCVGGSTSVWFCSSLYDIGNWLCTDCTKCQIAIVPSRTQSKQRIGFRNRFALFGHKNKLGKRPSNTLFFSQKFMTVKAAMELRNPRVHVISCLMHCYICYVREGGLRWLLIFPFGDLFSKCAFSILMYVALLVYIPTRLPNTQRPFL